MYEKFQNNKTRNLEFTDIYKLVEPIKKLEEGEWLPDIYFIEKALKDYAGLPEDYKIKSLIEHAAQLNSCTNGGFGVHESYPSIVASSFRVSVIQNVPNNNGAYAVGPYIAYVQSALSDDKLKLERERLGKNLLVFPAHSIRGLKAVYDTNSFCEEIRKISNEYDSVRVCLYWKDVLLGTAEIYQKYGFEVVTAGHYYDPMFMPRLKSIIETSTMTMSNKLGTYIGYCVYLNKPHLLLKTKVDIEKISSDGKFAEIEQCLVEEVRKKDINRDVDQIYDLLSENREVITLEQYTFLNKYWGFTEVKSPKQLRKLLMTIEGEHQLKNNYEKIFCQLQDNVKAKNDYINRLKDVTKQQNDKIKVRDVYINRLKSDVKIQNDKIKVRDVYINRLKDVTKQQNDKIKVRDVYINRLKNDVKQQNNKINAIMNSRSWKITNQIRKLKSYFK